MADFYCAENVIGLQSGWWGRGWRGLEVGAHIWIQWGKDQTVRHQILSRAANQSHCCIVWALPLPHPPTPTHTGSGRESAAMRSGNNSQFNSNIKTLKKRKNQFNAGGSPEVTWASEHWKGWERERGSQGGTGVGRVRRDNYEKSCHVPGKWANIKCAKYL